MSLLNGFHLSKWLKTVTVEWLISMDAVWIANKQYIRSESRPGRNWYRDYTMGNLESERLGRLRALSSSREEQAARPHLTSWRGSCPTPDTTRPANVTGAATLPISWLEGALSDADPVTNLRV